MSQFQSVKKIAGRQPPSPSDQAQLEEQKWVEGQINGGMITTVEPANIPTSAGQLVKNATIRYDRMTRRPGSSLFSPAKPASDSILGLVYVKRQDGTIYTLRIAPTSMYALSGTNWSAAFTGMSTLHGTAEDRLNFVDVLNTFCFSNNGADPIQTVNFGTSAVAQLGDAPAYRYITGFYNRVVGAALQGSNEVQIGWSGDGNPTEWNSAVDQTAGNAPLIDTPADLSDFIKGIFAFSNVMIVLREKSLWLATKQPIPTDPFYFYTAVPGIGCDCPYSAQLINGGIAWADARTRSVYAYAPGGALPEPIGRPIEDQLFAALNDVNTIFSAYNATYDEYTLFIPGVASNIVQGWTFNFRTKSWTYNEYVNITCASDFPIEIATLAIKDLVGTIGSLAGAINALSPTSLVDTRVFGLSSGDIMYADVNADNDNGTSFDTVFNSKAFDIPSNDILITRVVLEYTAIRAAPITLNFSVDDGNTWIAGKTITPSVLNKSALLIMRKPIRCRRFMFQIVADAGAFTPLRYEIWVNKDGESRR